MEANVQQQLANGSRAFVVSIYCMADGISLRKIEGMKRVAQERLLAMGVDVTGMHYDAWAYTAHFEVRSRGPAADERDCPRCAERIKAAALVCRFCGAEFGS